MTIDILPRRQSPEAEPQEDRPAQSGTAGEEAEEEDEVEGDTAPPAAEPAPAVPPPLPGPATAPGEQAGTASPPGADTPGPARDVDWQASLERASAKTVEEYAEVDSLHPEFDELRRIAATRYAEPRTGKPPPIWENAEDDIYGRTLLKMGNCFRVLDDKNVGNRYAFETFEQHLVFCTWGQGPRQKFPWIESIVARYPYLREPDGGAAGPAGGKGEDPQRQP